MSLPPSPPPDDLDVISSDPAAVTAALRRVVEDSRAGKDRFARIERELDEIRRKLAVVNKTFITTAASGAMMLSQSLMATMTDVSPTVRMVAVLLATIITGVGSAVVASRQQP
ncbi:MAG: hypothetical protein EBS91_06635 [Betaproteobacteria bacterium]|jgi:hypothetical protein|nr:hypothetical protein [Betaproteobacteria bacterium]